MDVNLPAFAHRVTVLGSTRNMVATSAGVSSGSASGVRADISAASPPVDRRQRSCDSTALVLSALVLLGACHGCPRMIQNVRFSRIISGITRCDHTTTVCDWRALRVQRL